MPTGNHIRLQLTVGEQPTTVGLGRGLLADAADWFTAYRRGKVILISDETVAPLVAEPLQQRLRCAGYTVAGLTIGVGETVKTLATVEQLYEQCLALDVERSDLIVAVGGGLVGDVAGFVAGTYLRGLAFAQVPTTLVAMVTASVGGKTAVNYQAHKNRIGVFKQPALVLADLETLNTLPESEYRSGLGELLTVGVLGAPTIFETLEAVRDQDLAPLIAAAIECKRLIVEADPYEQLGIRSKLNLGHTFGHALETLSNFALPHGIAVGVGLHIAARLAAELGLCAPTLPERIARILTKLQLPTALTGYAPAALLNAMRYDKKRKNNQLQFVLPVALGDVRLVSEAAIPGQLLMDVLAQLVYASPE